MVVHAPTPSTDWIQSCAKSCGVMQHAVIVDALSPQLLLDGLRINADIAELHIGHRWTITSCTSTQALRTESL